MSMISLEINHPSNLKRTIETGGLGTQAEPSQGIYLPRGWQHIHTINNSGCAACVSDLLFPCLTSFFSTDIFSCLAGALAARRQVLRSQTKASPVLIHVIIA